MAENVPPSDTTRGIPYYEKLKRDLRETLQKKRALDKNMASLEDQIYRFEASYLEETSSAGNIIKGFDNYIKGSALLGSGSTGGGGGVGGGGGGGGGGTSTRRKGVTEQDRVFSRSSCSYMREITPSSDIHSATPSHAPTPTSNLPAAASSMKGSDQPTPNSANSTKAGGTGNKKNNKKGAEKEDEESEGKQPKRLKITYARGGTGGD